MIEDKKKEPAAVRSFRVTDSVMERFVALREEMNLTQDSALAMLINTYELEQAKQAIPDRETEITNFQMKARELVDAFLYSLQLNQDAEARVRQEYDSELLRNKKLLDEKLEQIDELKAKVVLLRAAEEKANALQAELGALSEQARKEHSEAEARLAEKDRLIATLDSRLELLEDKAAGYDELEADRDALAAELRDARAAVKDQEHRHQTELERAAMAAQRAQDAAVAEVTETLRTKMDELQGQLREAQVAGVQAVQRAEKEAYTGIRRLEQENARLREELLMVKKQTKRK